MRNEKKLYDDIINRLSPEYFRGIEEGELSADEIVSTEDWKSLGNRINPEYSKLDDIACVCSATREVRWTERQLFFKLGAAVGRRLRNEPKADAAKGEVDAVKGNGPRGSGKRAQRELEEYLIARLEEVEPELIPQFLDEIVRRANRREFQLIKGGRYEPRPGTLKGESTL